MPTKTGAPRRYRRRNGRIILGFYDTKTAIYVMGRSDIGRRPRVITLSRNRRGVRVSIAVTRGPLRLTQAYRVDPDLTRLARRATRMVTRPRHVADLSWPPPPRHLRRILHTTHI